MKNISFEKRAVAFIDVLGFKSVVEDAASNYINQNILTELVKTLETSVFSLNKGVSPVVPTKLIPKHLSISDCIILSAPITSNLMKNYRGLSILVMRVIQLTHILLSKGYLVRGGISVGKVWHSTSNIIGPAYQEAYQIEAKTSVPRVELSDSAKKLWKATEGESNLMCLEYNNCFMVNGLHDFYIQDSTNGSVEQAFKKYHETIEQKIQNTSENHVRYKWWWFGEYFENEIERNKFIIDT